MPMMALTLVVLATTSGPAMLPSQPFGDWVVEQDSAACLATGKFGPDGVTSLSLATRPLSDKVTLLVHVPRTGRISTYGLARVLIEPGNREASGRRIDFAPDETGRSAFGLNVDSDIFRREPITAIRIYSKNTELAYLALGNFQQLLNNISSCERMVTEKFSIDLTEQARVAILPKAIVNENKWFHGNDYPTSAFYSGAQGPVAGRFKVKEDGSVADCVVVISSGNAVLDKTTCTLIKARARFIPAKDSDGRPVSSSQLYSMIWTLPY